MTPIDRPSEFSPCDNMSLYYLSAYSNYGNLIPLISTKHIHVPQSGNFLILKNAESPTPRG